MFSSEPAIRDDGVHVVVILRGELDIANAADLGAVLSEAVAGNPHVIADLRPSLSASVRNVDLPGAALALLVSLFWGANTVAIKIGLVDAVPDSTFYAIQAEESHNPDGITGTVSVVHRIATNTDAVGKFGWKGQNPTLKPASVKE